MSNNADSKPKTPKPMDCLTLPSGDRLTRSRMMAAKALLPPTRTMQSRTKATIASVSNRLTNSEIEQLRQEQREQIALLQKEFPNAKILR